eukprot:7385091-Prymnesium_polylepis.1
MSGRGRPRPRPTSRGQGRRNERRSALRVFCRLLGEGDYLRGLDTLLDREAAAAARHRDHCGGAAAGGKSPRWWRFEMDERVLS